MVGKRRGRFTEDFDTTDLKNAKAFFDDLAWESLSFHPALAKPI